MGLMMKIPVVLLLLFIIVSLIQGMYYLARDDGQRDKTRVVRALTVRILLSFLLFGILIIGFLTGIIQPNSVQ